MVLENATSLLLLYIRPVAAISRILDHGRLWFAILAAVLVSVVLHFPGISLTAQMARPQSQVESGPAAKSVEPQAEGEVEKEEAQNDAPRKLGMLVFAALRWVGFMSSFAPLVGLAVVFIPAVIFVRSVSGHGSFPVLMRSDYLSLLLCALMAWAAAYLPLALTVAMIAGHVPWIALVAIFVLVNLYFAGLAALSIRTQLGVGFAPAAGLAAIGCVAAVLGVALSDIAGGLKYYMMSPFLLYYAYSFFGSDVRSLGDGLRSRQHLQQQLLISTTNPRDADAHYQLGLVYQKRRQYTEAITRFQKAVEIDPKEADAQFQLGRIAREQGRFDDAIRYLKTAAALDDKLASSEVWRELGAAYFGAAQAENAAVALGKYTDRRSYDPEGLYWYGKSLAGLSRLAEARQALEQCVEAVDTMPKHRRAYVRQWSGLAKKELRAVAARR